MARILTVESRRSCGAGGDGRKGVEETPSGGTPSDGGLAHALFSWMARRSGSVAIMVGALTALLVVPFLVMPPDEIASTEPGGPVFTARDRIDESFVSSVYPTFFVFEPDGGDVLTASALSELLAAGDALRNHPTLGPDLFTYFDPEIEREVVGLFTLADMVDAALRQQGIEGVAAASDLEVKTVGSAVIDQLGPRSEVLGISVESERSDDGLWSVAGISTLVLSDDTKLGFGTQSVSLGGDTESEEYSREIQSVLQIAGWQVHGIAIDVNLTSAEQGAVAGPFIGLTIFAVLLVVGWLFGSYWVLATVGVAFMALIVWLKGISNLVGLEEDLVLSLIVPIAMISFGVDFAFHAIGRYREERQAGRAPLAAYVAGLTAVSSALLLALASDATAFLANVTSGIESINQFGVGAAIALASAYVLLGVVTPLAIARIEGIVPTPQVGRRWAIVRAGAGVGAAGMVMASVLLMVFVHPAGGVALGAVTSAVILVAPVLMHARRRGVDSRETDCRGEAPGLGDPMAEARPDTRLGVPAGMPSVAIDKWGRSVGSLVSWVAGAPLLVVGAAMMVTGVASYFALQVPAKFEVEDFFSPDTDFVIALDQVNKHIGNQGGEPALLYLEADLADPEVLAVVGNGLDQIRSLDVDALAHDDDGVFVSGGVFELFDALWRSPIAQAMVNQEMVTISDDPNEVLSDDNNDGIPDSRAQVEAVIRVGSRDGIAHDETNLAFTPNDVQTMVVLAADPSATPSQAKFEMALVGSRSQDAVLTSREALEPITEQLSSDLGGSFVQVTGSPFVREASLDATNQALQVSLAVALILCFVIVSVFLRSLRFGVVAVVPIVMVVAWLYAFMYLAGYAVNLVTATIAAVSIGVGIDFATHFIVRYRQELRGSEQRQALRIAAEGTGLALVASALSSVIGFGLLALAPMPLFASYGLLTALMIVFALLATLLVLPSLLLLVTRSGEMVPR